MDNSNNNQKFDKTFGEVFQNLRTAKNFSCNEAAEGVISPVGLSNFENGHSMPSFDRVYKLLKNINVTLLEFDDAYNRVKQEPDILLYDTAISIAFLNHDIGKLQFMLEEIEQEIKRSKNVKKYKIDKWRIEAVLVLLDPNYEMPSNDIFLLKEYLMNLDGWGLYDIYLFGYTVNIFTNVNDVKKLKDQMLRGTQMTRKLHNIERAVIQTMLAIIDFFSARKYFKSAEECIDYLNSLKIHDYYMYEKFTLKYAEANLRYQMGKKSALETMKKCQEIAFFCDCPKLGKVISEEIINIQKTND